MSVTSERSWAVASSVGGAFVWAALACLSGLGFARLGIIELLFVFAPVVIVPLGLALGEALECTSGTPLDRWTRTVQPAAALLVVAALLRPPGIEAAALAIPYLCFSLLAALSAGTVLFQSGRQPVHRLLLQVAKLDLVIGSSWLVLSRSGLHLSPFQEPIVLLTAVHFHYTGFGLATIAAVTLRVAEQRRGRSIILRSAAILVAVLPFLIAAGFVFSLTLKLVSVAALSISVTVLAVGIVFLTIHLHSRIARIYLRAASAVVLLGMVLATVYAISDYLQRDWLVIPQMAATHGVLNGLGFVLLALLGWLIELDAAPLALESTPAEPKALTARKFAPLVRPLSSGRASLPTNEHPKFPALDFYDR